jgi:transposase-like protein
MHRHDVRGELIRAVARGETVAAAASRLGVAVSTAYQWNRSAARPAQAPTPTLVEVVPEHATSSVIHVRIGAAEIEVRAGFDARLLREVVDALGGES